MRVRRVTTIAAIACATFSLSLAQEKQAPGLAARSIGQWTDTEVKTWMRSRLDSGTLIGDDIAVAAIYRSAIVVPLAEKKIEEVLKSTSPATCFSDPTVDPERFIADATGVIRGAGDENALKAASQLIKIDEARFGFMVANILYNGMGYRNPFSVAYRGFAIGDPAIDSRIGPWAEKLLSGKPKSQLEAWAEAMLERYSVVPSDAQWATDPLASRLSPQLLDKIRGDITRIAAETLEKHTKQRSPSHWLTR